MNLQTSDINTAKTKDEERLVLVTCAICDDEIELNYTGKLQYCKCKCLGVDSTKEYTRYLGTIPKEDPGYEQWKTNNAVNIQKAIDIYKK